MAVAPLKSPSFLPRAAQDEGPHGPELGSCCPLQLLPGSRQAAPSSWGGSSVPCRLHPHPTGLQGLLHPTHACPLGMEA